MPGTAAQQIVITPGYILGPYGDEILIDREVPIDLSKQNPTGALVDPCAAVDPWCSDVRIDRSDRSAWLVVHYAECDTRPVAVGASGCGCEDTDCEYSRTRDSFELRLLDEMPLDDLAPPDEVRAGIVRQPDRRRVPARRGDPPSGRTRRARRRRPRRPRRRPDLHWPRPRGVPAVPDVSMGRPRPRNPGFVRRRRYPQRPLPTLRRVVRGLLPSAAG